jgi:hypothetical protein
MRSFGGLRVDGKKKGIKTDLREMRCKVGNWIYLRIGSKAGLF